MFVRILTVGLCLLLALGCAKKTAKKSAADDEPVVAKSQQPQWSSTPGAAPKQPGDKAEEPNWLDDPRFKKDHAPTLPTETPPNGKPPGWVAGAPPGGWTAPVAGVQPSVPGLVGPAPIHVPAPPGLGGNVPNPEPVKPPATGTAASPKYSPVSEADMKDVWTFVENASGASGKMPTQLMIYKALIAAKSPAAELVKDGSIYLTGATTRESIWAFETKALTSGGLICSQNGVETVTAADLKKRLGK